MYKNQIDKYGIILQENSFKRLTKKFEQNPHVKVYWNHRQLHVTVTSKAVPIPDTLNYVTIEDIQKHSDIIFNSSGYCIPYEEILYSQLFWVDIKKDVENTTGYSNKNVISVLREKSYKNTTKNETPSFDKGKGFENSLVVTSTCKKVKDSICVYEKIPEINNNRWNDPDYYKNFTKDFLIKNTNTLRFERRLQSSRDIKKAFKLENLKVVTLSDIFNSDVDVVSEKVQKIFM